MVAGSGLLGQGGRLDADLLLEGFDALGAGELAGGDAEDALEAAEDGEAGDAGGAGDLFEAGAFAGVGFEVSGDGGDGVGLRVGARLDAGGLAAEAGAEAGGLGGGGRREEGDVLAVGTAAGTAWAAEDPGGLDGVDELAVGGAVALKNLLPLLAGEDAGDGWGWHGKTSYEDGAIGEEDAHSALFRRSGVGGRMRIALYVSSCGVTLGMTERRAKEGGVVAVRRGRGSGLRGSS